MNYCTQCGNRLQTSGRFCSSCGYMVAQTPVGPPLPPVVSPPAIVPRSSLRPLQPVGPAVTGSHFPFLFAISGALLLAAMAGLTLLFTVGLAATLSENRLAELGLNDCRFVDDDAKELFEKVGFEYKMPGDLDARRCQYEGTYYYMYPASDFQVSFQLLVTQTFCDFGDIQADMASARKALKDLESAHVFQVGQYVFTAETEKGQDLLRQYFDENGPPIHPINIPVSCWV